MSGLLSQCEASRRATMRRLSGRRPPPAAPAHSLTDTLYPPHSTIFEITFIIILNFNISNTYFISSIPDISTRAFARHLNPKLRLDIYSHVALRMAVPISNDTER